jgi:hypothetical protein
MCMVEPPISRSRHCPPMASVEARPPQRTAHRVDPSEVASIAVGVKVTGHLINVQAPESVPGLDGSRGPIGQ